jgi:hypothetical protein
MTTRGITALSGAFVIAAMLAGALLWQAQWPALAFAAVLRFCG